MSEDTTPETTVEPSPPATDEAAPAPAPADDAHVDSAHVFALLYVQRELLPTGEEEEEFDKELARLRQDIEDSDRYKEPLPEELRLGPDTVARYWAHAWDCTLCRCLLLEDGPGARPPQTQSEKVSLALAEDERRQKLKIKFAIDCVLGTGFFIGSTVVINHMRAKKPDDDAGPQLASGQFQIDPMAFLFMGLILVASWFLAEAYGIAKELWIDFSAWKKAVPLVGKAWHAKGKKKVEGPTRIGGGGAKPDSDS
ncbi:MAG: hypothetical protein JKY65_05095 [Planctomycetes bacterium]|nr:hypothetical protein [Planctomycetota bacterium]